MHMMGWGPHGCLCTHLIKATASLRGQIEHSSNLSDLIYPVKPFYCKICCLHIRRGPRPPTCLASLALRFVDTWHVMIWCHVTHVCRVTSQWAIGAPLPSGGATCPPLASGILPYLILSHVITGFRKLTRILVCGKSALCREVFRVRITSHRHVTHATWWCDVCREVRSSE